MNALNALIFAVLGAVMEALPEAFPSCFVRTSADCSSTRALWVDLMGAVQMAIGVGYIVRAHLAPIVVRMLSTEPARESGTLALPNPRGVAGR